MSNPKILDVSASNFDSVLRSRRPVVVDFWAEWCGPCRTIAPLLDALTDRYEGKVRVAKVNVDHNPELASRFGVRGIPTLLVFRGGEVVNKHVGGGSMRELEALFKKARQ